MATVPPRVLITGANGMLGAAAAAALRKRGARVLGLDLETAPDVLAADLRDESATAAAIVEATERLGGLDVLVNNAGLGGPSDPAAPPDELARQMFEVNVMGTWRATAAALPELVRNRGRVVNVSSGLAFASLPHAAAYSMTKRAIVAYGDVLRAQHGHQLSVVAIFPGYVPGPIHASGEDEDRSLAGLVREETVEDAQRLFVDAVFGPPRLMRSATPRARAELALAHKLPEFVDAMLRRRVAAITEGASSPDQARTAG